MKQTTAEKIDPLTRIQEEIKEVVRREQEYRQLNSASSPTQFNGQNDTNNNDSIGNGNQSSNYEDGKSYSISSVSTNTVAATIAAISTSTILPENSSNTPSPALNLKQKENIDELHSDDSGISASSSPINGMTANTTTTTNVSSVDCSKDANTTPNCKEQRYIGPNCYSLTPEPPQQKLIANSVTVAHFASTKPRQFLFNPVRKGVMQRFIASRGRIQPNNNSTSHNILLNNGNNLVLSNGNSLSYSTMNNSLHDPASIIPVIERDAEGKPIRPGYVPVEVKIQRELNDLKTRESELKKIRKIRQSTPNLIDLLENSDDRQTDGDDAEVEHCYSPGKLRAAKSISELCDSTQSHSLYLRTTPSPDYDMKIGGMRPAMSLAQLCDLDPEDAPSSHRLIAQWERLIQRHA